jgi:Rhodopirellula transposase DDE domain
VELQKLADAIGLAITVCHVPPGTSKWNAAPSGCSSKFDFCRCRRNPREPLRSLQQQAHRTAERFFSLFMRHQ